MHFSFLSAASAAALLAGQFAHAAPTTQLQKRASAISAKLPEGVNTGVCDPVNMFNTPENRKINWVGGNGWELVERFIDQNGVEMWAQNIFKTMFPQDSSSDFSCITSQAGCSFSKSCNEFDEAGAAGMHYVLNSMKNIHTYFKQYSEDIGNLTTYLRVDMEKIFNDFKTDEKMEKPMDAMAIIGTALGIGAEVVPHEGVATGLGAASALVGVIKDIRGEPEEVDAGQDAEEASMLMVNSMVIQAQEYVEGVRNALFGVKGSDQTKIPAAMKWNGGVGAGQDYKHAITWALGDGMWLLDNPTEGLDHEFSKARRYFKQMLAVQVLRISKGAFVIIDGNAKDEEKCLQDSNAAWEAEVSYCYTLYHRNSDGGVRGGLNDFSERLWLPESENGYGMDKLATYKNAIDCWKANDGAMGAADSSNLQAGLPKCAFGMEVKKGRYFDFIGDPFNGAQIKLDQAFPNFPNGEKHDAWPDVECTHQGGLKCGVPTEEDLDIKYD